MCARQGTEVMENRVNRTMSISSKMAVDMVEDLWKRLGELEGRFRKADEVAFSEESTREVMFARSCWCAIDVLRMHE